MKQNRLLILTLATLIALTPAISTGCSGGGNSNDTDVPSSDSGVVSGSDSSDTSPDTSADTTDSGASSSDTAVTGTTFTFSNNGISVTNELSSGYSLDGTTLELSEPGTYIVTGTCSDGSVKVKKGTTGVTLVLNNLTLSNTSTAPIVCAKSSEVEIIVLGTNALSDSEQNNDDNFPDNADAENAVMKFKDGSDVILSGSGTLKITANGKNGIKSGSTTDAEGEASLTIRELTLDIDSQSGDAVNAEALLNVESGSITISASDDALHSDYTLNIGSETTSPTILINTCNEGIEAAELNIWSGDIKLHAIDDCLNAANSDLSKYDFSLNIYGGNLVMDTTGGDGIDSNGSITITGGNIVVWTANTADNQPLDSDGLMTITGGTVLAAGGSSGMGMNLSASQPYITFGSTSSGGRGFGQTSATAITKGAKLVISGGSEIYSGEALTNANYVFFSSDKLTEGESYTLTAGGNEIGTSQAQTGTSEGGMGGGKPSGGFTGGMEKGDRKKAQNGEMPEMPGDFNPANREDGLMPGGKAGMPDDFNPDNIPEKTDQNL